MGGSSVCVKMGGGGRLKFKSMNRDGGVKEGGEVPVGQVKVLMGILREQNHSHRWLRSLYLVAKTGGAEFSYKITSEDSGSVWGTQWN